jgi:hypothetical protein
VNTTPITGECSTPKTGEYKEDFQEQTAGGEKAKKPVFSRVFGL